jgi:excisionase family DNA binding protein
MGETEHAHAGGGLLSVDAAAAYLGVSVRFVREQIALGELIPVRLGRRVLIEQRSIDDYIGRHRVGGEAA